MSKRIIVFSTTKVVDDQFAEISYSNPTFWKQDGVRKRFSHVFAPQNKEIVEAYIKAGAEEYKIKNEDAPADDGGQAEPEQDAVEPEQTVEPVVEKPKRKRAAKQEPVSESAE